MKLGSLFSGAAGLDRAVETVFGATTAWHCELDSAASKVLAHRYPGVPNLGDITAVDWDAVEPVDILCGGYPCQPFSAAGQRKGTNDERHLWPHFADAIRGIRPRYVVLENVAGHRSMGFGDVLGDLAVSGYDAQWCSVRASDVGAPHRRERLFVLATDTRDGVVAERSRAAGREAGERPPVRNVTGRDSGEPVELLPTPTTQDGANTAGPSQFNRNSLPLNVIATLLPTPSTHDKTGARSPESIAKMGKPFANLNDTAVNELTGPLPTAQGKADDIGKPPSPDGPVLLPTPAAADGQRGQDFARANRDGSGGDDLVTLAVKADRDQQWGKYGPAIQRWEQVTRPAPAPTEPNSKGNPRLSAAFSEWMMGWPAGWVTDVPGVSRNDQLRIVGNGVCPQQAEVALRYLLTVAVSA